MSSQRSEGRRRAHCIPIDPNYLSYKVRTLGYPFRFVELAGEINQFRRPCNTLRFMVTGRNLRTLALRVRGAWDRTKFLAPTRYSVWVSGGLAVGGLGLTVLPAFAQAGLQWSGLIIALLGVIHFLWGDLRSRRIRHGDLLVHDELDLAKHPPELSSRYHGFRWFLWNRRAVLISDELNRQLENANNPLVVNPPASPPKNVPTDVQLYGLWRLGGRMPLTFNDEKVRLASDVTAAAVQLEEPLAVQQTDYFSGLCTNLVAGMRIRKRPYGSVVFDGRELLQNGGVLYDLEDSPCSNHIGVSTLAFTTDGHMVRLRQSPRSAHAADLLAPSGSGSIDFTDYQSGDSLSDLLKRSMERELLEEIGLVNKDPSVWSRLIGYSRDLHRGGKPEFYGISVVEARFVELRLKGTESVYHDLIESWKVDFDSIEILHDRLALFVNEFESQLSMSLYFNIRFLLDALERDGANEILEWINHNR